MRNLLTLVVASLLLAGCSGKEIPDGWISIIESEAATPAPAPRECSTEGDPKWTIPPDRDELENETARRDRKNKNAFSELAGRRRVCAAGIVTAEKQEGK
jgi:hypothetical protein